jgi:plastocyanin
MIDTTPRKNKHCRLVRAPAKTGLRLLAFIALMTALLVLPCQPTSRAYAGSKTVVVTMTDKPPAYVPPKLTVKVGTTVQWKNTGNSLHDVTTDASKAQNKNDVALPSGAKPFDSGFMAPGTSWSYTFTVPGRYEYACIPHEKDHMLGEIIVTK